MKKILIGGLFLALIGFVFLNINKLKLEPQIEPDCEAKMIAINEVFENFEGVPKPVDFSDFPEAKTYYTRITESVKKGANFAGYFRLIIWGVGTDVVGYAVVDLNSSKVISYEPANPNYHLRQTFDLNSSYFILDPLYVGEVRKFYMLKNGDGIGKLVLACTEKAEENYYTPPNK